MERVDDITEILSVLPFNIRKTYTASMKKGLADAFGKFDEYQFAKYNRQNKAVKLKDILALVHPKPNDDEQSDLWRRVLMMS